MIQRLNEGVLSSLSVGLVSLSLLTTPFLGNVFPLAHDEELQQLTETEQPVVREYASVRMEYDPLEYAFAGQRDVLAQPSLALESLLLTEQDRFAAMPDRVSDSVGPVITAEAVLVLDRQSGAILYEKNAEDVRPMASLTKVMTGLLSVEQADLNGEVVFSAQADAVSGSSVQLTEGARTNARDLVMGMMVASGNDAAYQLADYTSGSQDAFVQAMNDRAQALGMTHTSFVNPYGLDASGHVSTAADIAQLLHNAWKNDTLRESMQLDRFTLNSSNGAQNLRTTNELRRDNYPLLQGGKTGFTEGAGHCLAVVASDEAGNEIVAVLLGSPSTEDRWHDMKSLLSWTYQTYAWNN